MNAKVYGTMVYMVCCIKKGSGEVSPKYSIIDRDDHTGKALWNFQVKVSAASFAL